MIVNPEILMGSGEVEKLWKTASFTKRILNFIFDEGHCISQWGTFRKEYLNLGQLCYLIPEHILFYVALATLPLPILLDVVDILKIRLDQAEQILHSNDCPEISLLVRRLTFSAKSFQDLAFLIPEGFRTRSINAAVHTLVHSCTLVQCLQSQCYLMHQLCTCSCR